MRKIIFALNSKDFDLSSLTEGTNWEKYEIDELSGIDYNLIKSNKAILLVGCSQKQTVLDLFASFELSSCNLPTVFLMSQEDQELVQLCYQNDFTHLFMSTKRQLLLKAHINYAFENYELSVRNNGQKWLRHIDPNSFTKKEFQIIEFIAQAPLTELSREELQSFIWGKAKNTTNKLDVHICNLRKKLNDQHVVIQTNERGKVSLGFSEESDLHKKVGV